MRAYIIVVHACMHEEKDDHDSRGGYFLSSVECKAKVLGEQTREREDLEKEKEEEEEEIY
jgi:hypothetical protein